eukprot:scaffold602925_cov29-Prasinocladus_malaysianus.AAC.1
MAAQAVQESAGVEVEGEDIIITDKPPSPNTQGDVNLADGGLAAEPKANVEPSPAALSEDSFLFFDGKDSLGRPVVVIRTCAIPSTTAGRKQALDHM